MRILNRLLITVSLVVCSTANVRSDLKVDNPGRTEARPDDKIQQRIEHRLFWSPLVDDSNVRVRVTNGVAHLTGTVKGWDSYGSAIEKAFEGGARRAVVQLIVPGFTFRSLGNGRYEVWHNSPVQIVEAAERRDSDLKQGIERHLFWSPFVDRNRVRVSVRNGIAVLTGTVDDWSSHGGATENAFEGGATAVRNLLQVTPD